MQKMITALIPLYGELNRIYKDYIDCRDFSFEKQKMIATFHSEYEDITVFEKAVIELVLHMPQEQYILLLMSLEKEIGENVQLYETHILPDDDTVVRICHQYADRYKTSIKEQLETTGRLNKPLNEAYNRYDSIGYREHTAEEEKLAEMEYERCKAEYDRGKTELDKLYDLQKGARKEAFQYMKNYCEDIYRRSCLFLNIVKKYIPDGNRQDASSGQTDRKQGMNNTSTSA